jgi:hypothetical protein
VLPLAAVLQAKVYYADMCFTPAADMRGGLLKYTLNVVTGAENLQLFVASGPNSTTYGEVPHKAGGVVIPVLGKLMEAGSGSKSRNVTDSFGYSGGQRTGAAEGRE